MRHRPTVLLSITDEECFEYAGSSWQIWRSTPQAGGQRAKGGQDHTGSIQGPFEALLGGVQQPTE